MTRCSLCCVSASQWGFVLDIQAEATGQHKEVEMYVIMPHTHTFCGGRGAVLETVLVASLMVGECSSTKHIYSTLGPVFSVNIKASRIKAPCLLHGQNQKRRLKVNAVLLVCLSLTVSLQTNWAGQFSAHLTQGRVIWDSRTLTEKTPPSDWLVDKPVGHFLN